ncbi:HEPN domain-containing protein [Amycolatopsis sp. ATCC 39116]|uniref:HEPN domain-containing protein n=1 Tax=Amycolatopsis sp. (strain ATCC 39116 / 75iv2) TaxID=385957 RepID=UPI0012F8F347|nr:HEPN domain-containing protein [Amycolatopsis sp. ATCC 39116]
MQLTPREEALLRVSKAGKKTLGLFEEGLHLTGLTSQTFDELREQVCADRLSLADRFIVTGSKLMRARPAEYRSAISRYYYAMYHSVRAVVYFAHKGDDHQEHSKLPSNLPNDFPGHGLWLNDLKDARAYRNDADYDPYPLDNLRWKDAAKTLAAKAPVLAKTARQYLRQKGCSGV